MPDMRFAPPTAMRVSDSGGLNQTSVRTYNERLVMSLLRQKEGLSRMEIGQISGLSAQTVSVIVRALEEDGLCVAGAVQKGRIGPPSTPMFINPDGAFSIGVHIGLRSTEVILIDFLGACREYHVFDYVEPRLSVIFEWITKSIASVLSSLSADRIRRIVGIGLAVPAEIESWNVVDPANSQGGDWSTVDLEAKLTSASGMQVFVQNDLTAAAGAEVIFGAARNLGDFAYFFIGAKSDFRLILNHHIHAGKRIGSSGGLISLLDLELALHSVGKDSGFIWRDIEVWPRNDPTIDEWIRSGAEGLVSAIIMMSNFVAVQQVILEGRFPLHVRDDLLRQVRVGLDSLSIASELLPSVQGGDIRTRAKAVGAASIPLYSRFMLDKIGLASG